MKPGKMQSIVDEMAYELQRLMDVVCEEDAKSISKVIKKYDKAKVKYGAIK